MHAAERNVGRIRGPDRSAAPTNAGVAEVRPGDGQQVTWGGRGRGEAGDRRFADRHVEGPRLHGSLPVGVTDVKVVAARRSAVEIEGSADVVFAERGDVGRPYQGRALLELGRRAVGAVVVGAVEEAGSRDNRVDGLGVRGLRGVMPEIVGASLETRCA